MLGEVLLAPMFKNAVMDLLISKAKKMVRGHDIFPCHFDDLASILGAIHSKSPLRRLLVDLFITGSCLGCVDRLDISKPEISEFTLELAIYACELLQSPKATRKVFSPWRKDVCFYHDHSGKAEGRSCK